MSNEQLLSSIWLTAKKSQIGAGFRPASKKNKREFAEKQKILHQDMEGVLSNAENLERIKSVRAGFVRHPFMNGNNKFIFWKLSVPKQKPKKSKKDLMRSKVFNSANKVTRSQELRFVRTLDTNIHKGADFFLREILPVSMSLNSSVTRVDEILQQIVDDKSNIPVEYMKKKAVTAIHLRIIRFIGEMYELTDAEKELMVAEFKQKVFGF